METPAETFTRLYHRPWPGGRSAEIRVILEWFDIHYDAGSAEANLALQGVMLSHPMGFDLGLAFNIARATIG